MKTGPPPTLQLWGIYYTDREFAREKGDPLRTVIEAVSKSDAEQEARRLGFDDAWAHPVTLKEAENAQWLPGRRHSQQKTQPIYKGIRV